MTDASNENDTGDAATPERPLRWFDRRRSIAYRTADRLSRLTAGLLPSPDLLAMAAFQRENDPLEDQQGRLDAHERISTSAIWATEAYTPDNVDRLIAGLERISLGHRGLGGRNPAKWVREQRRRPGSSFNMHLSRPHPKAFPTGFAINLPRFARSAAATIWSVTPSLTLITVMFTLEQEDSSLLDRILRSERRTKIESRRRGGVGFVPPSLQRSREVAETRKNWAEQATGWFRLNVPGVFSLADETCPTCELTVVTGFKPFPTREERPLDPRGNLLLSALRMMSSRTFVPDGEAQPGVFFSPHPDADARNRSIVAMTADHLARTASLDGERTDMNHVWEFDARFRNVISQWAIAGLIDHFGDRVSAARDGFARIVGQSGATRALARVRRDTAACADAATVAREVVDGLETPLITMASSGFSIRRRDDEEPVPMTTVLRDHLRSEGRRLLVDVSDLNANLHSQAALLSAHANLKLQPWIVVLAVVSAIAGVVAAVDPVMRLLAVEPSTTPAPTIPGAPPVPR